MSFIYAILARLLPTRSVDSIVSVFTKVAEQLARAEAVQLQKAAGLRLQASEALDAANSATAQADRAAAVRQNLAHLTA